MKPDATAKIRELLPKTIEELENFTLQKSKEALALLDAERPSAWISVEEQLPEYDKGVIAHVKSGSVLEMKYASNKNHPRLVPRWEWMGRSVPFWEITHWMPLPAPPDVKE